MKQTVMTLVVCAVLAACGGTPGEQGPKGDKGDTGAAGLAGQAGAAGPGINQTVNYSCLSTATGAHHEVYKFPDGSIMTNCEMIWTTDGSVSSFYMWRSGQGGASTAYCSVLSAGGWAEFNWNGNLASTQTVHGSTVQTYTLNCTKY